MLAVNDSDIIKSSLTHEETERGAATLTQTRGCYTVTKLLCWTQFTTSLHYGRDVKSWLCIYIDSRPLGPNNAGGRGQSAPRYSRLWWVYSLIIELSASHTTVQCPQARKQTIHGQLTFVMASSQKLSITVCIMADTLRSLQTIKPFSW